MSNNFLKKVNVIHDNFYSYDESIYINSKTKIIITCPVHGDFAQEAGSHVQGQGCPACGIEKTNNKNTDNAGKVIDKFRKKHGDKYDYSKVAYINSITPVTIICPEHGEFLQQPAAHTRGSGCMECGHTKTRKKDTATFIKEASKTHNNKYDYSKVAYTHAHKKVTIICPEHGEFSQSASHHINGRGCATCARGYVGVSSRLSTEEFIKKAVKVHGNKFDYSKVDYVNSHEKVMIICPEHGEFEQVAVYHLSGSGCQKCGKLYGKTETEIGDYVASLGVEVSMNEKLLLGGKGRECDIVLHDLKIVIEYDGSRWHSEQFTSDLYNLKTKSDLVRDYGYECIHIQEHLYLKDKEKVLTSLRNRLGLYTNKIWARQTKKREICSSVYKEFCEVNHYHGHRVAKVKQGLFYDDVLVAVVGIAGDGELVRYCVKLDWQVGFALAKLIKNEGVSYSFCDQTFFNGGSYLNAGFKLSHYTAPNYIYVKNYQVRTRQQMMKHKLHKVLDSFDATMTEVANCNANGWYRLFDCGNIKYVI